MYVKHQEFCSGKIKRRWAPADVALTWLQAEGARTRAGTWAPTPEEAELIEMIADKDAEWEASLKDKKAWINRPSQPPGLLRSGVRLALLPALSVSFRGFKRHTCMHSC